jgi:membrane-associated phospholipid phosphatase
MTEAPDRFWRWPDAAMWQATAFWTVLVSAWFAAIYVGAWQLTQSRSERVPIHFDWELAIPLWPWTVVVYESMLIGVAAAPFILRSPREVRAMALAIAAETLVAGIAFVLVPAEAAFAPMPDDLGVWTWPVQTAMTLNLGTVGNMAPSLHVAMTVTYALVFAQRAGPVGKTLLFGWAAAVAASTVLLHQHHVVDVVTGALLGWLGKRFLFDRWSSPLRADA